MSPQLAVAQTDTYHRTQRRFGTLVNSRQETALSWLKALAVVTGILAVLAFIGAGNLFAIEGLYSSSFNGWAAIGGALTVVVPMLPWIGLFHVLGRVDEGDLNG